MAKPGMAAALLLAAVVAYFAMRPGPEAPAPRAPETIGTSSKAPVSSAPKTGAANDPANPSSLPAATVEEPSLLQKLAALSADPIERQKQLDAIAAQIPDSQLERALDSIWAAAESGPARDLSMQLLRRWGAAMPEVAAAWLAHKPPGGVHEEASLALATTWAKGKSDDAAAWVRTWPEEKRPAGLLAVAYEAARNSPTNALWLAAELPAAQPRDELIEHAVREWASRDSETALSWAAQMGATPLRDQVIASLSLALSDKDPAKAAALALETLPEGRKKEDVVVGIVQRWAQTEPERTAEWVEQFPEIRLRNAAVENLVRLWADKSMEGPAEWVGSLQGEVRDTAAAAYAQKLTERSPAQAAAWVESIQNQDLRQRETEHLAERWLAIDQQSARQWLETADLPQEIKSRLTAPIQRSSPE